MFVGQLEWAIQNSSQTLDHTMKIRLSTWRFSGREVGGYSHGSRSLDFLWNANAVDGVLCWEMGPAPKHNHRLPRSAISTVKYQHLTSDCPCVLCAMWQPPAK